MNNLKALSAQCNSDICGRRLARFFVILIVGTVLLAAVITPYVYAALRWAFEQDLWPFSRVYDRVALAVALLILMSRRRDLPVKEIRNLLTAAPAKHIALLIAVGLVVSLSTALAGLPGLVASGRFIWNDRSVLDFVKKISVELPLGLLISFLEEFFFRAVMFVSLSRRMPWFFAAILSSLLYSVVHFVQPVKTYIPEQLNLAVGYDYTYTVVARLFTIDLLPAFFGLFLVGVVLCAVLRTTGSIYICIGLHTGWILAMKLSRFATIETDLLTIAAGASRRYFVAAQASGWISIIAAFVLIVVIDWVGRRFWGWNRKGSEPS